MWIFEKGIDRTTAKEIVQRVRGLMLLGTSNRSLNPGYVVVSGRCLQPQRAEISEEAKSMLSSVLRFFFFMGDEDELHLVRT